MKNSFLIFCILFFTFSDTHSQVNFNQNPDNFPKSLVITAININEGNINTRGLMDEELSISKSFKFANTLGPDIVPNTRSIKAANLYKNSAPSVVWISTDDSFGSGSFISSEGHILTNAHVVEKFKEVAIVLKPLNDAGQVSKADIRRGKVLKVDQVTDLALIQLVDNKSPRPPLPLGDISEISVGLEVHAIGHPSGNSWTYTKGVISQYRNNYEWSYDGKDKLKAAVIQTQTPISPGNSGGPLFSDNGRLIGVNTFGDSNAQGVNFAISIEEIRKFLSRKDSRYLSQTKISKDAKNCQMREISRGKLKDNSGEYVAYDSKCGEKTDLIVIVPHDTSKAIFIEWDRNLDGKTDVMIFSEKRNYSWDFSFWDENFDGRWDLFGFHRNGEVKPYKFEDFEVVRRQAAKR